MSEGKVSKEEMKKKLDSKSYNVLFEKGTERPFSGKYLDNKRKGKYECKACGNKLFDSDEKFDSGTGWPSFSKAIAGSFKLKEDNSLGMKRVEIMCAKCGGHLGHVFDDGPKEKGGKRYCINSCSLDFEGK